MSSNQEVFQDKLQRSSLFFTEEEALLTRLTCPLCSQIMMEPVQGQCGCRFCHECIHNIITGGETKCPSCEEENKDGLRLTRDKAVEREILRLEVRCPNTDCCETMLLKKLSEHMDVCDQMMEACDQCQRQYGRAKILQHMTEECAKSVIVCEDCGQEMTRGDLVNTHKNTENLGDNLCERWFGECPYKCGGDTTVLIKTHLDDCPDRPRKCPLKDLGCQVRAPRGVMEEHMEKDGYRHQIMMMKEIKRLTDDNSALNLSFLDKEEKMKAENERLKQTVSILTEELELGRNNNQSLLSESGPRPLVGDIVTNDGTATWTIRDIRRKIQESRSGGSSQIVSESFYVARPGYCMSMKVYLNVNGRAKDHHLSAFFVLNKGDYDNEISWPFISNVTLRLLSNKKGKSDVVLLMKPQDNEACYGRPRVSSNDVIGKSEFVKSVTLLKNNHYLHEGAIKLSLLVH